MTGGFHAFALVPSGTVPPDPLPTGLERGSIALLPAGQLIAVAQPVSGAFLVRLQEGGADEASRAWLTDRLLEHEQVVEGFVAAGPVFPLGFGVLLADAEAVRAAVAPNLETLAAFFASTAGRQEWCLKFYLRETPPRRGEMALAARNGLDYLAARRALPEQQAARDAAGCRFVEQALARLRPLCETMLGREAGIAPGKGLRLLANLALLISGAERQTLVSAVEALVAPAAEQGLELTLTGPWPLYSFRPLIALGGMAPSAADIR
jgi:hypothetical protein